MTIEIVKKGEDYALRRKLLGFIPVYWQFWTDSWSFGFYAMTLEAIEEIIAELKEKAAYKKKKIEVIRKVKI